MNKPADIAEARGGLTSACTAWREETSTLATLTAYPAFLKDPRASTPSFKEAWIASLRSQ
jgi:hypothetical protein